MLVDLKELRDSGKPLRVRRSFTSDELDLDGSVVRLTAPAEVDLTVSLQGELVRVQGRLDAPIHLICCRCLQEFPRRVVQAFDLEYEPDPVVETEGEEIALSYGDLAIGFYRNDELELAALVGEQILLDTPMKPICRQQCRGLCPHCGADRNEEPCDCNPQSQDPRLAVLQQLKERMTE